MMNRLLVLFFIFLLISSCRSPAPPVAIGNKPVSINDVPLRDAQSSALKPEPEMGWTSFEGKIEKIKDLQGKVIILDFWATFCPPCIEEIPHLMELQTKYGKENIQVIGLHVGGGDDRPKVPEFVERLKITYPLAFPEDALTSYIFGQDTSIPQTAIFDRKGHLVKKIIGFSEEIRKELDIAVESAVNTKG